MLDESSFQFQWITGDGGPLIMMEEALLSFWEGSDAPSGGRVVEAESRWGLEVATDYDKACDVNEWAGVIDINNGKAFVLSTNGDAMGTWVPNFMDFEGALLEWGYADNENDLIDEAKMLITDAAFSQNLEFEVKSSPLVLFMAVESGREPIYKRLSCEVGIGKYFVRSGVRVTDKTSVACHLFQLQGQSL